MAIDKVIINYTGWIEVEKSDLKIQYTGDCSGQWVDTENMSGAEIAAMLNSGEAILESFGETYLKTLDGEDQMTFENEVDED